MRKLGEQSVPRRDGIHHICLPFSCNLRVSEALRFSPISLFIRKFFFELYVLFTEVLSSIMEFGKMVSQIICF